MTFREFAKTLTPYECFLRGIQVGILIMLIGVVLSLLVARAHAEEAPTFTLQEAQSLYQLGVTQTQAQIAVKEAQTAAASAIAKLKAAEPAPAPTPAQAK